MSAPRWLIRPLEPADLPGIIDLEASAFAEPWDAAALAEEASAPGALALIVVSEPPLPRAGPGADVTALADPQPRAYVLFRRVADEAELLRVAVHPHARRQRLAHALVRDGLARLTALGTRTCHLEVRAGNAAAIALYRGLGFAPSGHRRGYYRDGEDALLMAWSQSVAQPGDSVAAPEGGCYPRNRS